MKSSIFAGVDVLWFSGRSPQKKVIPNLFPFNKRRILHPLPAYPQPHGINNIDDYRLISATFHDSAGLWTSATNVVSLDKSLNDSLEGLRNSR
jgi:hypothetical protein